MTHKDEPGLGRLKATHAREALTEAEAALFTIETSALRLMAEKISRTTGGTDAAVALVEIAHDVDGFRRAAAALRDTLDRRAHQ